MVIWHQYLFGLFIMKSCFNNYSFLYNTIYSDVLFVPWAVDNSDSSVHYLFYRVRWNRALRELGEANPCVAISVGEQRCAHAYFMGVCHTPLQKPNQQINESTNQLTDFSDSQVITKILNGNGLNHHTPNALH